MNDMYYDFVTAVKNKLHEDLNGTIKYECYEESDTVVFKVFFKDFSFGFAVSNVIKEMKDPQSIAFEFKARYEEAIKNAFFKSPERKAREKGYLTEDLYI